MAEKIDPKALALGLGIPASLCFFLLGISTLFFPGYGEEFIKVIGSIYVGYVSGSPVGSIIGAIWSFLDFAIFGYLIAIIYNKFQK